MSIFDKKVKKTWSLKVLGTEELKERYEKVIEALRVHDTELTFKVENLLEDQLELIITKAEKELLKLKNPSS